MERELGRQETGKCKTSTTECYYHSIAWRLATTSETLSRVVSSSYCKNGQSGYAMFLWMPHICPGVLNKRIG